MEVEQIKIEEPIEEETKKIIKKYEKYDGPISEYTLTKPNGKTQKIRYIRKKYISPEQIEDMKNMLVNKIKRKDICAKYNITMPTLKKYIG